MLGLSGSQEALIVFALIVGVVVFYKAREVDIATFDPITAGTSGQVQGGEMP